MDQDHQPDAAVLVLDRVELALDPDLAAFAHGQAQVVLVRRNAHGFAHEGPLDQGGEAQAPELFVLANVVFGHPPVLQAPEPVVGRVDLDQPALGIENHHAVGRLLDDGAEALFTGGQGLFLLDQVGDVDEGAERGRRALVHDALGGGVHPDRATVLGDQLEFIAVGRVQSGGALAAVSKDHFAGIGVHHAQDVVHGADFCDRVAHHLLAGRVAVDDAIVLADVDRNRRGLGEGSEHLLAFLEGLLAEHAVGYVQIGGQDGGGALVGHGLVGRDDPAVIASLGPEAVLVAVGLLLAGLARQAALADHLNVFGGQQFEDVFHGAEFSLGVAQQFGRGRVGVEHPAALADADRGRGGLGEGAELGLAFTQGLLFLDHGRDVQIRGQDCGFALVADHFVG
ncbi:MAG: hypothetical protein BWY87_01136 [Deltaproteobacteria bacterium ADurb.Bin510]|nr:MAG: hypothetical protein BWY87_01136 [Deltaproteobacteria bacterium ADurb.Bin510]